jgi:hypothetical protein
MKNELAPRVDGSRLDSSYYVQRCTTGLVPRDGGGHGYDGNWAQVQGCELAFAFKLKSGDLAASVTCPVCGEGLQTTTRRLRQGFLLLSDAEVEAIQTANGYFTARPFIKAARASRGPGRWDAEKAAWKGVVGVPVPVACVATEPAPVAESVAEAPAPPVRCNASLRTPWGYDACDLTKGHAGPHHASNPMRPASAAAPAPGSWVAEKQAWEAVHGPRRPWNADDRQPAPKSAKLVAAEAALATFDAKPRCAVCWGYNASVKTSDRCSFCREWGQTEVDQTALGARDQYTWSRGDLVARVVKGGGTPPPAPLAGYDAHVAERDARKAAERDKRIAELRARGVRV